MKKKKKKRKKNWREWCVHLHSLVTLALEIETTDVVGLALVGHGVWHINADGGLAGLSLLAEEVHGIFSEELGGL